MLNQNYSVSLIIQHTDQERKTKYSNKEGGVEQPFQKQMNQVAFLKTSIAAWEN